MLKIYQTCTDLIVYDGKDEQKSVRAFVTSSDETRMIIEAHLAQAAELHYFSWRTSGEEIATKNHKAKGTEHNTRN